MPVSEKAKTPSSSSYYSLELDPLLSDLAEKKLRFRRSLAWLDAELKDARIKLASKEQLVAQESENRKKFAESKARSMEEEVRRLQKCLQDKDEQLRASLCSTEQYLCLHKLDVLRSQLSVTQATAEASAASAMLAQSQCLSLSGEHEMDTLLGEHELQVNKVEEQLDLVQKYLEAKAVLLVDIRYKLEKHRMADHELKKKVLKLECTLKESRSQLQKLQRMGERRDKALKKLESQLQVKQTAAAGDKQNLWERSGFRLIASMSILALAMLAKR